nr:hypothetical protein [Janthinobacterium sp. Marseille]
MIELMLMIYAIFLIFGVIGLIAMPVVIASLNRQMEAQIPPPLTFDEIGDRP